MGEDGRSQDPFYAMYGLRNPSQGRMSSPSPCPLVALALTHSQWLPTMTLSPATAAPTIDAEFWTLKQGSGIWPSSPSNNLIFRVSNLLYMVWYCGYGERGPGRAFTKSTSQGAEVQHGRNSESFHEKNRTCHPSGELGETGAGCSCHDGNLAYGTSGLSAG
ncbi:uncharacterized protein BO95DRAFT_112289 [Aspergillus brunneoviolaceus CBS 621.78]|uniref:Uncharacterized protein n=1 Tax=Aspergillus brunneoviolaceus CBS 621.78 TaxID=1450534 RepID=A0ACD1GN31_9EURO|nr:hypothetical protein BO95DRAFT_112289 [Aspergillus brunneoviolaceus CBS 621.78]RAH50745.1 hypothetical protein BO95DRAFT_112289 [Aspergillus brunneoviolaceus CBS 621.78]